MTTTKTNVLLARLMELSLALAYEVTTRPMMGGHIAYADGRVFVSISSGGLGIKLLPQDQLRALERPRACRMRHSPTDPPSKSYITFASSDIADDDLMIEWLQLAASTAPARKKR